jgi:hypothetical protein
MEVALSASAGLPHHDLIRPLMQHASISRLPLQTKPARKREDHQGKDQQLSKSTIVVRWRALLCLALDQIQYVVKQSADEIG